MKFTLVTLLAFLAATTNAQVLPRSIEEALWAKNDEIYPQNSPFVKINSDGTTCRKKCMMFGLAVSSSGMNCVHMKTAGEGWAQADTNCEIPQNDPKEKEEWSQNIEMNQDGKTCKRLCSKIAEIIMVPNFALSDDGLICKFSY